jgi:cellulose synthase/poly-beta-1,6-N-acetylglucosamine synthase-like glycosyltransferase
MSFDPVLLAIGFWVCLATVFYAYVGYPLLIWWLARRRGRPRQPAAAAGTGALQVAVLIAAHDEEKVIARRLDNLLASEYPADRLLIVVASDGSTDQTNAIVGRYAARGVRLVAYPQKRGKAATLNDAVAEIGRTDGAGAPDVIVFADARQTWAPDALCRMVGNLADPEVGAVSGDLVIESAPGVLAGVGTYWRYEKWLRRQESRAGSMISVTGAISAVRYPLFRPIPPGTILDDMYWPLQVAMQGYRVVHEERAVAFDRLPPRVGDEFRRKVRTLSGNFQLIARLPAALVPWRNPVWLQFLSHKVCRLLCPWALIAAVMLSAGLPGTVYAATFWGQILFYGLAVAGLSRRLGGRTRLVTTAGAFLVLNAAAWFAWWTWLTGWSAGSWVKVRYANS